MGSKIGSTLTRMGVFAGMGAINYVMDRGLPDISALPVLSSVSSGLVVPSPKFKVEYKSYREDRQTQCGRNLCPLITVPVMRLKIQSLNEQPILVKNVIVNDNADCSANPLAKLSAALKAEGRDPGLLERVPPTSSVTATMKYGDVATVPLFGCEPVRVRVITERGERIYEME
jgi:hypothetical protein